MYSFPYLEPVCCSMSSSNCCFLTCIQISQEAGQVVWYSHLLKNFPQFVVIHTVKGFSSVQLLSHVRLFAIPWTAAYQDLPSMGFSRQEFCSGLPFPSPGDLPDSGTEPRSPALQADSLLTELQGKAVGINWET